MIKLENITKTFGPKKVLDRVSFEVGKGETLVIVGLSGAGKSVTLKHIIRLLTPDSGRVLVGKRAISEARGQQLKEMRSRFGVLFQSAALLQWLTVHENVALPLREHTQKSEGEIDRLVREKLSLVGLSDVMEKFPVDISGGMQKRVGLARAVIMEPEIILYDEPTSGLDPVTSRSIDKLMIDMRERLGVTSVVVTHDLYSALAIGSRIIMIHEGEIVENASPEGFVASKNATVKSFLDSQYITRQGDWEHSQKLNEKSEKASGEWRGRGNLSNGRNS